MKCTRRPTTLLTVALVCACAGDVSGPGALTGSPGIRLVAGGGQSDTVDVVLAQALIVEVRDTLGRLAPNQVVRFETRPDTQASVGLAPITGQTFSSFVAETTSALGQAGVLIQLGTKAGIARLYLSVPAFAWADTATVTVGAGGPARVYGRPSDTTLSVGASFQLRSYVGDRHSNPRPDPVTYQALDTVATVSPAGLVTAHAFGIGRILAIAAGVPSDTSRVGVVPAGTIAASTAAGLMIVNLDGSGYQVLPIATADYQGRYPSWLSATAIAAMDGRYYAQLLRVGTNGTVQYLVPKADTVVLEVWPQASRDGAWIYFGGLVPGYSTAGVSIWRVQPTGAGLERVSPPNADGTGDTHPSPSPDGTKIAAATTRGGGFALAVIDVATKQLTPLNVPGLGPRWAPAGDSIAYLGGGSGSEIWLVNANGSGARRVSPAGRSYALGIDWSSDRRWIIARGQTSLELIEVATAQFLLLAGLPGNPTQPAWKP
jgi:hypothetical protein